MLPFFAWMNPRVIEFHAFHRRLRFTAKFRCTFYYILITSSAVTVSNFTIQFNVVFEIQAQRRAPFMCKDILLFLLSSLLLLLLPLFFPVASFLLRPRCFRLWGACDQNVKVVSPVKIKMDVHSFLT